jgi:Ricin-type beta-trefoil lectin domain
LPSSYPPRDALRRRGRSGAARAWTVIVSSLALGVTGLAVAASASAQPGTTAVRSAAHAAAAPAAGRDDYKRACPVVTRPGRMACNVLTRTNVPEQSQSAVMQHAEAGAAGAAGAAAAPAGDGYGPASLQSAYKLPSSTAGSGQTVALIDAYDDPDAASDLATYRSDWGLPACGTGCFEKVGQTGSATSLPAASGSTGWATEESLDIDMVAAICPLCHIILVEADSPSTASLGTAVNTAVSLGADFVSNSYGGSESSSDLSADTSYYHHPGVAITASAGDGGYGVEYPASSQYVTAVGGTSLSTSSSTRGWTETVWGTTAGGEGTGSGCSTVEPKPAWQTDTGCTRRTNNDVAAVADPNTGVAVYDTYDQSGWLEVGGTSAASPIIAAVYALGGTPAAGTYPASYPYAHTSSLFDVTSGADGSCTTAYFCTAQAGYDGPTGLGTPDGTTAFAAGSASSGGAGPVTSGISGKCLDDYAASTANGTEADLYDCNGTPAQQWTATNGTLQVNGKCLDIIGAGSTADGTLVDIWDCNGGTNQVWDAENGTLVNPASGKCLDDPGFATANGTQLDIWDCNGGANQQWTLPS